MSPDDDDLKFDTPDDYMDPDWELSGRVHDWRNHVSDEVQAMWHGFTPEQRAALARSARRLARLERWE